MPERIHKVVLTADVAGFKRSMSEAADATKKIGTSADDAGSKGSSAFDKLGGVASKVLGAAAIAGAAKAILDVGLSYESSLNSMQAVTSATGDEMARVSDLAKQLGNDITIPGASASDAAEAMTELAKGGLTLQESMAAAKGTLQLATAAQISGAEAATIQADALNAFNLKATEAGHVADLLANAANAATGDIGDFGAGLAQASAVANGLGISVDDTVTVLGLFANAGIKGSDAGTSFKTMLTQLQNPTDKAAGAMAELGITAFDAQGNFVGMRTITEQLAVAQANMSTQAFSSAAGIVFGSDAIRGATVLASSGVKSYDNMSAALGKTGGAAQLAAAQAQGLPGAFANIQNQAETVALSLYEKVSPAFTDILNSAADALPGIGAFFGDVVSVAGDFVSFIADLPGPVLTVAGALAAVAVLKDPVSDVFKSIGQHIGDFKDKVNETAGAAAPLGDALSETGVDADVLGEALGASSDKAKEVKTASAGASGALHKLGAAGKVAGAGLLAAFGGPIGLAITAITTVISQVGSAMSDLELPTNNFSGAVDELTGKVTALKAIEFISPTQIQAMKDAGISLSEYSGALTGVPGQLEVVQQKLLTFTAGQDANSDSFAKGIDLMNQFQVDLSGVAGAEEVAAEKARVLAEQNRAILEADIGSSMDSARTAAANAAGPIGDVARTLDSVLTASINAKPGQDKINQAWEDGAIDASELVTQVDLVMGRFDLLAGRNGDAEASQRAFNAAARDYTKSLIDQGQEGQTLTQAEADLAAAQQHRDEVQGNLNKSAEEGGTTQAQLDQANRDVSTSTADLARVQADQGSAADAATEKADELTRAMLTSATQAANDAVAAGDLAGAHDAAAAAVQKARDAFIAMQSPADQASGKAQELALSLFGIPDDVATTITANTLTAEQQLASIQGRLDAINGSTATATVKVVQSVQVIGQAAAAAAASILSGRPKADGGLLRHGQDVQHAANGMSRIARGGANLIHWAEPETVWESFISGKPSQRARNHGIMAKTAGLLGGTYIPPGSAQAFANGGLNGGAQRSFMGSSVVNNTRGGATYQINVTNTAERRMTVDELVATVRQAERSGRL